MRYVAFSNSSCVLFWNKKVKIDVNFKRIDVTFLTFLREFAWKQVNLFTLLGFYPSLINLTVNLFHSYLKLHRCICVLNMNIIMIAQACVKITCNENNVTIKIRNDIRYRYKKTMALYIWPMRFTSKMVYSLK